MIFHHTCILIGTARCNNERTFLEKNGPGLQHHCFVVEDTDNDSMFLKDKGVALASDVVEIGSTKMFNLRDPAGISVQVLQRPEEILPRW